MRSTIVRRASAAFAIAALTLVAGGTPALAQTAQQGSAYSKAQLLDGVVGAVSPKVEYEPGGKIFQPAVVIPGLVGLELDGLGLEAGGQKEAGKSWANFKGADARATVGIPGALKIVVEEAALDTYCTADGTAVNAGGSTVRVNVSVFGPFNVPIANIPINSPVGNNFGVAIPGGLAEVMLNKVVDDGNGKITASALSVKAAGIGVELGKVVCGPNAPGPVIPLMSSVGAGLGVLVLGGVGTAAVFALNSRRRRNNMPMAS